MLLNDIFTILVVNRNISFLSRSSFFFAFQALLIAVFRYRNNSSFTVHCFALYNDLFFSSLILRPMFKKCSRDLPMLLKNITLFVFILYFFFFVHSFGAYHSPIQLHASFFSGSFISDLMPTCFSFVQIMNS